MGEYNEVSDLKSRVLDFQPDTLTVIHEDIPGWGNRPHQFNNAQVGAIQAAVLANRPLLVRGDPGLGKTQLAPALATALKLEFFSISVHANTEINDLLYSVDHLKRLNNAQGNSSSLEVSECIVPGVLWKAIAPDVKAETPEENTTRLDHRSTRGALVLIDEIDKADASLPNALLEVLNTGTITVDAIGQTVQGKAERPVVVIITSNDDRELPAAFLRRCATLDIRLMDGEEGVAQLMEIYDAHKNRIDKMASGGEVIEVSEVEELANDVIRIRCEQKKKHDYAPGTSEFLDVLTVLSQLPDSQRETQKKLVVDVLLKKRNKSEE